MHVITIPNITDIKLLIDDQTNQLYYNIGDNNIPVSGDYYDRSQIQEFLNEKQQILNYSTKSSFALSSNMLINCTSNLNNLTYYIPSGLENAICIFGISTNYDTTTIITDSNMYTNKIFNFEPDKKYIISVDNTVILWNELTKL